MLQKDYDVLPCGNGTNRLMIITLPEKLQML